jgi:hypothetical protein
LNNQSLISVLFQPKSVGGATISTISEEKIRPPASPQGACSPVMMAASMGAVVAAMIISYLYVF